MCKTKGQVIGTVSMKVKISFFFFALSFKQLDSIIAIYFEISSVGLPKWAGELLGNIYI